MKNLMFSTAIAALSCSVASAQDMTFLNEAQATDFTASEFIGKRIYTSETAVEGDASNGLQDGWEDIGEVNDVILSRDGAVEAVLVDIGGFLGIGERHAAVRMDAIHFVSDESTADNADDYFLVMNTTRGELEKAPDFAWRVPTAQETGKAIETAAANTAAAIESGASAAADATEKAVDQVGDKVAAAGAEIEKAGDRAAAEMTGTTIARDGYEAPAETDLTTEMLTGAKAYDANDEWIGEVSELILDDGGKITHGVIDVGGFLGLGEKPVELAMSDISILRETGGDDVRVYVPLTREQLDALPTYEK